MPEGSRSILATTGAQLRGALAAGGSYFVLNNTVCELERLPLSLRTPVLRV